MPFSQLADHINTLDGTREGQCTDVKAYLAQKNVKDVLPSWPDQPIALPKASYNHFRKLCKEMVSLAFVSVRFRSEGIAHDFATQGPSTTSD